MSLTELTSRDAVLAALDDPRLLNALALGSVVSQEPPSARIVIDQTDFF